MIPELPNPALVPFVVSVTGHRDLREQDLEQLRNEVEKVLTGFQKRMPNTPILILSGLAEGADQLVAEIAIAKGLTLGAILPMPMDVYRTTMPEAAQSKLTILLEQSAIQIVLPQEGRTSEQLLADVETRSIAYDALALFLARHGQALIALWDGKHSDKLGGTSRVVHYVRSGTHKGTQQEVEAGCGLVYHVITPRRCGAGTARTVRTVRLGCKHHATDTQTETSAHPEFAGTTFAQVEINFERFNKEALRHSQTKRKCARFMKDGGASLSAFNQRLEALYGIADAISVRANHQRQHYLGSILGIAIVGTIFYGIHGELFMDNKNSLWMWFSFPFFVLLALLLHRLAHIKRVEIRYLDARALAEALRVQFFWELAGIHRPVDQDYLSEGRSELDWIRFSLKNLWLINQSRGSEATSLAGYKVVLENWVENQQNWFRSKAIRQARIVRKRERMSRYGLLFAVLWSFLVPLSILTRLPWHALSFIFSRLPWHATSFSSNIVNPVMHITLAVPALLAAAYRLWIEQAGYEEQAREYRFMERQFETKAHELAKHLDAPLIAKHLLLELGIEALKENGKWLLLHRQRPLEVLSSP